MELWQSGTDRHNHWSVRKSRIKEVNEFDLQKGEIHLVIKGHPIIQQSAQQIHSFVSALVNLPNKTFTSSSISVYKSMRKT